MKIFRFFFFSCAFSHSWDDAMLIIWSSAIFIALFHRHFPKFWLIASFYSPTGLDHPVHKFTPSCRHSGCFQCLVIINPARLISCHQPLQFSTKFSPCSRPAGARNFPRSLISTTTWAGEDYDCLDYFNFQHGAFQILGRKEEIKAMCCLVTL